MTWLVEKPLKVQHPAFANDKVSVPVGEDICVLIRLYREEVLGSFLN
jgi:hypothetical protein